MVYPIVDAYVTGALLAGTPVPEGMVGRIIKGGTIVRAQIGGENFDEILNNAYLLISDMVLKNGYNIDYREFYWIEFYSVSRFCIPLENKDKQIICDWIMPCIKQ